MTTTVVVTTAEALEQDRILFRLSSMVDTVRDTAAGLLMSHRDQATVGPVVNTLRNRYNAIHDQVLAAVDDEVAARLRQWLEPLPADADMNDMADLSEVYTAAAALAGFIDLEFNIESWMANRMQNSAAIAHVMSGGTAQLDEPHGDGPSGPGGQYL